MDFTSRTKLKWEIIIYAGYFSMRLRKYNIKVLDQNFKFPLFAQSNYLRLQEDRIVDFLQD